MPEKPTNLTQPSKVLRFNLGERIGHWAHAISFVALLLTGSTLVFRSLTDLVGAQNIWYLRSLHRVMAVPFSLSLLILLVLTPRSTLDWIRACFIWSKDDLRFLIAFPREFFGLPVQLPPQGRFNAGEKINSLLTLFGSLIMATTGWILVFRDSFSKEVLAYVLPVHDIGALVMGSVIIGHVYLSLGHPHSREAIKGMIWGRVSAEFAQGHHALWYAQLQKEQNQKEQDQRKEISPPQQQVAG